MVINKDTSIYELLNLKDFTSNKILTNNINNNSKIILQNNNAIILVNLDGILPEPIYSSYSLDYNNSATNANNSVFSLASTSSGLRLIRNSNDSSFKAYLSTISAPYIMTDNLLTISNNYGVNGKKIYWHTNRIPNISYEENLKGNVISEFNLTEDTNKSEIEVLKILDSDKYTQDNSLNPDITTLKNTSSVEGKNDILVKTADYNDILQSQSNHLLRIVEIEGIGSMILELIKDKCYLAPHIIQKDGEEPEMKFLLYITENFDESNINKESQILFDRIYREYTVDNNEAVYNSDNYIDIEVNVGDELDDTYFETTSEDGEPSEYDVFKKYFNIIHALYRDGDTVKAKVTLYAYDVEEIAVPTELVGNIWSHGEPNDDVPALTPCSLDEINQVISLFTEV